MASVEDLPRTHDESLFRTDLCQSRIKAKTIVFLEILTESKISAEADAASISECPSGPQMRA